ncbi:hypothetical protein ABH930_000231 [Kitasatospora sp. GAS204A]|uniref:hypothetical protein n=1 Tax=unclassified Kitasatospora TaxID=2633591 RepID=UPI0024739802|nr:hypothetical protein [Kitasatospora sp. GAS204B]MDH6116812.1 hypothetical protein [Kitasatospora sp. GAS204B]
MNWEETLQTFDWSAKAANIVDRSAVASDGTNPMVKNSSGQLNPNNSNSPSTQWLIPSGQFVWTTQTNLWSTFDACLWVPYLDGFGQNWWYTFVGIKMNYPAFDTGSAFSNFYQQPGQVLTDLLWGGAQNDTTSVWSFDAASQMIGNFDSWLVGWQQTIQGWRDTVGDPSSDWQGTAANEFRMVLDGLAGEFSSLHDQLNMQGSLAQPLQDVRSQLGATHRALWDTYNQWLATDLAYPANCFKWVLGVGPGQPMNGVKANIQYDSYGYPLQVSITTPYGTVVDSPKLYDDGTPVYSNVMQDSNPNQAFWDNVRNAAMQKWLLNLQTTLDVGAGNAMSDFDKVIQTLMDKIPTNITPAPKNIPLPQSPSNSNINSNSNLNPNLDSNSLPNSNSGLPGGGSPGGGLPGGPNSKNSKNSGSGLPGGLPGSNSKNSVPNLNKNSNGLPNPNSTHNPNLNPNLNPNANPNSNGDVPLLGPNGQPLKDKHGNPIMVPPGSTIGKNGELYGPDGHPYMIGGHPYFPPKGSKVGTQQQQQNPNANSDALKVPAGSKINADGTVTGPDGKLLTDSNGNKIVLGQGDTISHDGSVLDSSGNPVSQSSQLLADEEAAMSSNHPSQQQGGWNDFNNTPLPQSGPPQFDTSNIPASTPLPTTGGAGSGFNPQQVLNNGGLLTPDQTKAAQQAAALNPDQVPGGQNPGRSTSSAASSLDPSQSSGGPSTPTPTQSQQPPMMPPMGGMGGMGAGGAGGQGQERQRTTWLSEDEETWGTESTAVDGVIGR